MSDESITLILIVTTTNGIVTEHEYSLPNDPEEARQMGKAHGTVIEHTLSGRQGLLFDNPLVHYHKDHVVSVAIDFRGEGDSDAKEEVRRQLGFRAQ